MAEQGFQERTEAPTDKRRSEARSKGSVAKSAEANSVVVLLTALLFLKFFGGHMMDEMGKILVYFLGCAADPPQTLGAYVALTRHTVMWIGRILAPFVLVMMVAGVLVDFSQVGLLFTFQSIMPNFSKINPISGMGRLFSVTSAVEAAKSILKIMIVGWVVYTTIMGEFNHFFELCDTSPGMMWTFTAHLSYVVILRVCLLLIILAILDYAYQKWQYEKNLKMTKEEVKEERKQADGDPQIKSRIKTVMREMHRKRMMQHVPQATVVVTNPTHLAIAIRYEPEEMETPKVLAKGKRLIAERIKQIAVEHGIPIIEDKPLARAMYDKVEPGDDIPVEFFSAVAEIMAYVYRLKNRMAA